MYLRAIDIIIYIVYINLNVLCNVHNMYGSYVV